MNSLLVLRFDGEGLADYDSLIELEDEIEAALGESSDVDGHDMGCGEMNIFVFTSDPVGAFEAAKRIVDCNDIADDLRAAYRPANGSRFTILWPPGLRQFSVK